MSWGDSLGKAWQSATQTAKDAYQTVGNGVFSAYKEAVAAKNQVVDAASAAAERAKQAAVNAAQQAQQAASDAYQSAKQTASDAYQSAKQTASDAVDSAKQTGAAAVKKAQDAAQATFGPRVVGQPIQKCPCDPAEKKARAQERAALISSARSRANSLPPDQKGNLLATASRFEADNKTVDRARISQDVYDKQPPPPPTPGNPCSNVSPPVGWSKITDPDQLAQYGLTPQDMKPDGSGFRAGLYKNNDDGSLVLAFKGTESKEDWLNNFKQGLGMRSDYYDKATQVSRKLADEIGPNFEVAGHSLGGGLASAAALAAGVPGTTFNAAGLNDKSIERYLGPSATSMPPVLAYQVQGDVLTGAQEAAPALSELTTEAAIETGGAGGVAMLPVAYGLSQVREAYGTHLKLPAVTDTGASYPTGVVSPLNPLQRHYMDTVINGLEKQKADDQAVLKGS